MRRAVTATLSALAALTTASAKHVLVRPNPRTWPAETKYHKAHGGGGFVVDSAAVLPGTTLSSVPYAAEHKLTAASFPASNGVTVRLDHASRASPAELDAVAAAAGTAATTPPIATSNGRVLVTGVVTLAAAQRVAAIPWVIEVHARGVFRAHTLASQLAELGSSTVVPAWPGLGAANLVAVGDTGLDAGHCAFWDPFHAVPTAVLPTDTVPSPASVADTGHAKLRAVFRVCLDDACATETQAGDVSNGHGTFVSDQATGLGTCPAGGPGQGVAPAARLVFFSLGLASQPDAIELPTNFESLLGTALAFGAASFSASWGSDAPAYDDLTYQIDDFVFKNPSFVFSVAAGNNGVAGAGGTTRVGSPAGLKNGLCVGASMLGQAAYADGSRGFFGSAADPRAYAATAVASFTSQGPTLDGRLAPALAAPGVGVIAADAGGAPGHTTTSIKTGTSMAAPNLPVANVRQRVAAVTGWAESAVSSATVRAVLLANTVPPSAVVDISPAQSSASVSASAASRSGFGVLSMAPSFWSDATRWSMAEDAATSGESNTFCFVVAGGGGASSTITAVLAWNDPPGAQLVNALGLLLVTDLGLPTAQSAYDVGVVDNKKRVVAAATATARVTVYAPGLVVGPAPQPYSVVVRSDGGTVTGAMCSPGACSPLEPPVACGVAHGSGTLACDAGTATLGTQCYPVACDPGYAFAFLSLACEVATAAPAASPAASPPGTTPPAPAQTECDLVGEGEAWTGAECTCVAARTAGCANIPLCGEPCAPPLLSTLDVGNTTLAPSYAPFPDDTNPALPGVSYWLGISFWIAGLCVFGVVVWYASSAVRAAAKLDEAAVMAALVAASAPASAAAAGAPPRPGGPGGAAFGAARAGAATGTRPPPADDIPESWRALYGDRAVSAARLATVPEFFVGVCTWNLFCGAAVAFDCADGPWVSAAPPPVCLSTAHLWGLWVLAAFSVAQAVLFVDVFGGDGASDTGGGWARYDLRVYSLREILERGEGGSGGDGGGAASPPPPPRPRPSHDDGNFCVLAAIIILVAAFALMDIQPYTAFFVAVLAAVVLGFVFLDFCSGTTADVFLCAFVLFVFVLVFAALVTCDPAASPGVFAVLLIAVVWAFVVCALLAWQDGWAWPWSPVSAPSSSATAAKKRT